MLPDKSADARVVGDGVEAAARSLIARGRPLDATVVHVGPGDVGDFRLQEEGDIFMENGASVSPALRQAREPNSADGRLNGGEVARGDIQSPMIIAHKEV